MENLTVLCGEYFYCIVTAITVSFYLISLRVGK